MKSHFLSALIVKDIFLIHELNEVNDLQNILKILQNIKVNNFTEIFLNSKKKICRDFQDSIVYLSLLLKEVTSLPDRGKRQKVRFK